MLDLGPNALFAILRSLEGLRQGGAESSLLYNLLTLIVLKVLAAAPADAYSQRSTRQFYCSTHEIRQTPTFYCSTSQSTKQSSPAPSPSLARPCRCPVLTDGKS